jgi:hypothetical protein
MPKTPTQLIFPNETNRKQRNDGIGGEWYEYTFDNGYGASVIRNAYSYGGSSGKWEVAVTHDGPLCYATPVTQDVIGWLDEDAVAETLVAINALPSNGGCTHLEP